MFMYIIVNIFVNTQSILKILALKFNGLNAICLREIITTMFRGFAKFKKNQKSEKNFCGSRPNSDFYFLGTYCFLCVFFVLFSFFKLVGGA